MHCISSLPSLPIFRLFFTKHFIYVFTYIIFSHYHLLLLWPPLPSNHHTVAHVHEPFFLFAQSLHLLTMPPTSCHLFSSMSLSLFCLLIQFVHQIPHMSEIIWYLSFSDWLISLSIMFFSRFIHTVAKGKSFFLSQPSSIPLCKCPIIVLSTHLMMDTWAASVAW